MRAKSIFYSLVITLAVSPFTFSPSIADDDMPMGQNNSQQSKMGGMGHDMMMPMGKGDSQQSKMDNMPMGQQSSQGSSMGSGNGMKMPMGGMGSGQNGTAGAMEGGEHSRHHGGGMSSDTVPSNSMQLPSSSLQDQVQIEQLAQKRINNASNMITEGVLILSRAKESNDRNKMHEALRKVHYGVDQFESGLAAQEALNQGEAPRNIAMQWFKKELNLTAETNHGDILGISWFHFFVMVALVSFAVIMIWMYFCKMRRATEVLSRVTGSEKGNGSSKKEQSGS